VEMSVCVCVWRVYVCIAEGVGWSGYMRER
jgi:hypothetical protein